MIVAATRVKWYDYPGLAPVDIANPPPKKANRRHNTIYKTDGWSNSL